MSLGPARWTLLAVPIALGCAGSETASSPRTAAAVEESAGGAAPVYSDDGIAGAMAAPMAEVEADFGGEPMPSTAVRSSAAGKAAPAPANAPRLAQASAPPATGDEPTVTDAVERNTPLLIYTAEFHLAVYEVKAKQAKILTAIRELEGFLAQQSDTLMVVRVPVANFEQAVRAIEEAGDVLHRNVQAQDVSEEFHDLSIRIRNAEAMRDRLEQLLSRANNVNEALSIERELQRITESIERMKGRQRYLADRISFSTVTVHFSSKATDPGNHNDFKLPFDWLDELGVNRLLTL